MEVESNTLPLRSFYNKFLSQLPLLLDYYHRYKAICLYRLQNPIVYLILKIALVCILAIFIILFSATLIIDPNRYKAELERMVNEETGQVLILEGPLKLRCFPSLALEANNILLKENLKQKRPILKIDTLKIFPSLWSLFPGRIDFNASLIGIKMKSYFIPILTTKFTQKRHLIELSSTNIGLKNGNKLEMLEINKLLIDSNSEKLKFYLKHDGEEFQLPLLLSTFGHANKISGRTNLKIELEAEGNTIHSIKKSLNGKFELEISDGNFHGIDLILSLKEAKSLLGTLASGVTRPLTSIASSFRKDNSRLLKEKTPFKTLKVIASVKKGVIHTHELDINHRHYGVKGIGKINLIHGTLEYRVNALYKKREKSPGLFKKNKNVQKKLSPLIIDIKGPYENLSIRPDLDSYLKYIK